jgi:hypothetical protein
MEKPELLIFGISLLAMGGVVFYLWLEMRKKIIDIVATPTSKIGSLLGARSNSGKIVEVKGKLVGEDEMLKSPFANRDCVYYHAIEKDKVREVYYASGRSGGKRSRIYYSVSSEYKSNQRFFIEDGSGRIPIDPEGAEIHGIKVFNTIEPVGGGESFGFLSTMLEPCGEKIIAVIKEETILPANRRVYVIGELFVGSKGPFIGGSPTKDKTFMVSVKSEEELIGEGQRKMTYYALGWAALFAAGIALMLI